MQLCFGRILAVKESLELVNGPLLVSFRDCAVPSVDEIELG